MRNISSTICCGCGNCAQGCPIKCIKIVQDLNGFWKALCDGSKCINCGKCIKLCPMRTVQSDEKKPIAMFAAAAKDKISYQSGSSGGVFPQLAKFVLSKLRGCVWGCGYNESLLPVHKEAQSLDQLDNLCRSKYVQSYIGDVNKRILFRLQEGKSVLFVGTPCQVSGLRKFLEKDYQGLYLVDLVCHGVPSAEMFKNNIKYIERSRGKRLSRYEFRLKSSKINKHYTYTYIYHDGESEIKPYYEDAYYSAFYDMVSLNECCYCCPYACRDRTGDLTIGDFEWGKKYHHELKEFGAISSIIVNTYKGDEMLKWIKRDMFLIPTKWEYIVEKNLNLIRPTPRPEYRDRIYEDINEWGYDAWAQKYFHSFRYIKKLPFMIPFVKLKILWNDIVKIDR